MALAVSIALASGGGEGGDCIIWCERAVLSALLSTLCRLSTCLHRGTCRVSLACFSGVFFDAMLTRYRCTSCHASRTRLLPAQPPVHTNAHQHLTAAHIIVPTFSMSSSHLCASSVALRSNQSDPRQTTCVTKSVQLSRASTAPFNLACTAVAQQIEVSSPRATHHACHHLSRAV